MGKQRNIKREIKAVRKLFENNRDSLSRDEINEIRTELYKKELIYNFLKNKPKLNDNERRAFKRIPRYLKNFILIYQNEISIKKIIYMVQNNYLIKIHIINLLR